MWGHTGARLRPCSPVGPDEFVRVGLQEQPPQHVLHAAADVALGDAPQPGVHAEGLAARHVLQEGIELRAVPDPLLDLGGGREEAKGVSSAAGLHREVPWHPQRVALHLREVMGFMSRGCPGLTGVGAHRDGAETPDPCSGVFRVVTYLSPCHREWAIPSKERPSRGLEASHLLVLGRPPSEHGH